MFCNISKGEKKLPEKSVMLHTYFPQPLGQFMVIKPETNCLLFGIQLKIPTTFESEHNKTDSDI